MRSIQFPYITYFAYYISRGVLARANTSNISSPDLTILAAALEGSRKYNIGALITRRLSLNGEKGDVFGGIFASLVLERLGMAPHLDDFPLPFSRPDFAAMKRHEFISRNPQWGEFDFLLLFNVTTTRIVCLPAPFFV